VKRTVIALVLLLLAHVAAAQHLVVHSPPEFEATAARVRAVEGRGFAGPMVMLGLDRFGPAIHVYLAPEDSPLAARAPSWAAGYAVRDQAMIVLFPTRTPSYPARNLEALVHHEVTHILVARATRGYPLPRWFNEGVATVAAREWGLEDRARTASALIGRGPRSLAELDAAFAGGTAHAPRAYALSAALVRSLLRRHGTDSVAHILGRVRQGVPFESAVETATGTALVEIERHFFEDEALWTTWVPFLTSSAALWMGITALALVAIHRRRQRNAAMHARWEEEEARRAEPTGWRRDHGEIVN
jgi:hypothetical protein